MERISDTKPFSGQSEIITLTSLRKQPGEVFQHVVMGKVFQVTKCGKTIAWISPARRLAFEVDSVDEVRGRLEG